MGMTVFTYEGQDIPLQYKPSLRAKRLSLRVSAKDASLVLTIPPRATERQIKAFLQQCTPWVKQQLTKLLKAITIKPGEELSLHGAVFRCIQDPLRRKPALCKATQTLYLPPRCLQEDVYSVFKKMAEETLKPYLLKIARSLDQKVAKITVRDTKSRWGSCSARKTISLNWRLILAPPEVAYYVCIHEAAHLLHMNHSPAFWKVVAEHCPTYQTHKKWLKLHGASLMRV
jgi:predicted metal-dependent hydrolase